MLFNKNNNGQEELKELLGFLHASNKFANIKTDIILVDEEISDLIGSAVYARAQAHYDSTNYNTGSDNKLNDDLVHYIQLPVAYYATHNYAAHSDVTHGDDGRKVVIDNENSKMAWEWMLDKDDEATLNKAHKTTDRLIAFLEKNESNIEEWKNSAAQKTARQLFINTAKQFDDIFPIDNSRRFFIKLIPFMKEVERKHLIPVLGKSRYNDIKAAIKAGSYTDDDGLLNMIQVPVAYFTLSIAAKRFAAKILPNGIFQDYISEFQTRMARKVAPTDVRKEIAKSLYDDAVLELSNLQKTLSEIDAEALGEEYVPESPVAHIKSDTPIMRL